MPSAKPKPAEIASEVKRHYAEAIRNACPDWPAQSYLFEDTVSIGYKTQNSDHVCKISIVEGDPVDIAIQWGAQLRKQIPVINPSHEKRPGGDWEAGVLAPEECLCRRSNLHASLTTPTQDSPYESHYPIPVTGGIYSKNVVVFRDGPEHYNLFNTYKSIPVISVPPVKRPKISSSSGKYSFSEEKELMRDKIRAILRIAACQGHSNFVTGPWGCGPQFRNPPREVAQMWRDLLFHDDEFDGQFSTVVFAFDTAEGPTSMGVNASNSSSSKSKGSSSSSSASSSSSSSAKSTARADCVVWREIMASHMCD